MEMYGESTVYSYGDSGGISLMSVEPPDEAIVGPSGDLDQGSGATATRFRWWISANGDGTYSGGISGVSWFRSTDPEPHKGNATYPGPFENMTDEEIYQEVLINAGTLNSVFKRWNDTYGVAGDTTITKFTLLVQEDIAASDCVIPGGGQG